MKAMIAAWLAALALAAPLAAGEEPAPVGSRDLIDKPFDHDGRTVSFEGEAIGEPMRRGDWAWVNLLDGYAAIGVFAPEAKAAMIESYGSSGRKGDMVRVEGTFHRACLEHGGDMDIHASSVEAIERGGPTPRPVDPLVLALTPVSSVFAALCCLFWRKRRSALLRAGAARDRQER